MNGPLKEREETSRALVSVSLVSPMHKISDFLFVFFWLTMDVGPGDRLAPTGQLPLYLPHSILPPPCGSLSLDIFFEIVGKTAMKDQTRPHFYYSFRVRRLVLIDLTRHLTHFFSLLKFEQFEQAMGEQQVAGLEVVTKRRMKKWNDQLPDRYYCQWRLPLASSLC